MTDWLSRETRLAARGLVRSPSFSLMTILILGVGIGVAAAIVSALRVVVLNPLPVSDPSTVAVVRFADPAGGEVPVYPPNMDAFRVDARRIRDVAVVDHIGAVTFPLLDGDRPVTLAQAKVTGTFFDVLGAKPVLGRFLAPGDDLSGSAPVLVLSHRAWRQVFGGDSSIIGRHLREPIFRRDYAVVGIAPAGLDYPAGVDYWITGGPLGGLIGRAVVRLAPGQTSRAVGDELLQVYKSSTASEQNSRRGAVSVAQMTPFVVDVVGDVRPVLITMTVAVALLLAIACANVGALFLLRASGRSREGAIRRALGGSTGAVAGRLWLEAGLLGAVAVTLSTVVAAVVLRQLGQVSPTLLPRGDEVGGVPVLSTLGIGILSILLAATGPGLLARRSDLSFLRAGHGAGTARAVHRARRWLVAGQVGLAVVMLAGAGLLGRSLLNLERLRLGYDPDRLAVLQLAIPVDDFREESALRDGLERIFSAVRRLPGVEAVSPLRVPPFVGSSAASRRVAAAEAPNGLDEGVTVALETGGPEHFKALGVTVARGRAFDESHTETGSPVAVVSEAVARQLWPDQDPIGKQLKVEWDDAPRTVVGVASDAHYRDFKTATPTVYVPWRQWGNKGGFFAVRTGIPLEGLAAQVRVALRETAPSVTLWRAQTMAELIAAPLARPRSSTALIAVFGVAALVLSAAGLYGLMASTVADSTRELGVRIALGAGPARVRADVLRRALAVVGVGAGVGLVVAVAATQTLRRLLFGVSPSDPLVLIGAPIVLLAVGVLAAWLPARRATRVDPAETLRTE